MSEAFGTTNAIPVLFKAGRITAHLLQNLQLLASPNGATVETSYGERWLAENAKGEDLPHAGETVLLVLCSSPYRELVPARLGVLAAAEVRESLINLRIELGDYLATGEQNRIARLIARWDRDARPGYTFVSRGFAGEQLQLARRPENIAEAWTAVTTRLKRQKDYEKALFARIASELPALYVSRPVDLTLQLAAARDVRPDARLELRQGAASLHLREQADGFLHVAITAEADDDLDGSLALVADELVAPALPLTSRVSIESEAGPDETGDSAGATVADTPAVETPAEPRVSAKDDDVDFVTLDFSELALRRADIRRLIRDAASVPPQELGRRLGELALESAPDDAEITAHTASLLIDAERWEEAAHLLGRFEAAVLPRTSLYQRFLADCATGRLDDVNSLLGRLDFESDEHFSLLLRGLGMLPDGRALRLARTLTEEALDEGRWLDLFHRLRERITDPDDVYFFADQIQYINEHEAVRFLMAHTEEETPNRKLLELLVEVASAVPGNQRIGPQVIALGRLRLESGDVDGVFDLLGAVESEARPEERLDLVETLADALVGMPDRHIDAVNLLSGEVETALSMGLIERAAALARRAAGISSGDPAGQEIAQGALERAERALRDSEPLRTLLAQQRESRLSDVRARVGGQRLVIVGGRRDENVATSLRETFGFTDVRWFASEKNKQPDIDAVRQQEAERTIMVVLTQRIGHSTSTPVIRHCETHGIPCVLSRVGVRAIEDALLDHNWERDG